MVNPLNLYERLSQKQQHEKQINVEARGQEILVNNIHEV